MKAQAEYHPETAVARSPSTLEGAPGSPGGARKGEACACAWSGPVSTSRRDPIGSPAFSRASSSAAGIWLCAPNLPIFVPLMPAFVGIVRPAALVPVPADQASPVQVRRRTRQRHRHHRARRQIGPPADRMLGDHCARSCRAAGRGIHRDRRAAAVGVPLGEALRAHGGAHAAGRGSLSSPSSSPSSSRPAATCPRRSATCRACCVTASGCRPKVKALSCGGQGLCRRARRTAPIVMVLVYITTPDYILPPVDHEFRQLPAGRRRLWMICGIR